MSSVLRVDGVGVAFGSDPVLQDVAFTVEPGSALAIMGPSGSGKTTLLECLTAIRAPDSGQITLGERVISQLREPAASDFRRTQVGLVSQDAGLLDELTVVENVQLLARFNGTHERAALDSARIALAAVEMADREDERVLHLSGGEAHRVSIARATAHPVALLVADEPTASLDRANAENVTSLLLKRASDRNIPLVLATHDVAVGRRCHQVVELRRNA